MKASTYFFHCLRSICLIFSHLCFLLASGLNSQEVIVFHAGKLFDGMKMQENWTVVIQGDKIISAGPKTDIKVPEGANVYNFPDSQTIMPGMIEGHSHLLLHPYDETSWNDQVLKESLAERAIRAGKHAELSLRAGITTMRDLGSLLCRS